MAYITGSLTIERVIRPNAIEELLCLKPASGAKSIIFDLEDSLKRTGLCAFIKECEAAQASLTLASDGGLILPPALERRFEFYREYSGLSRWIVLGVDILQIPEDKKNGKADEKKEDTSDKHEMKKLDAPPPPPAKPKPKVSVKLEPRALNIIPASVVWIAEGSVKKEGPAKALKSPLPISNRLGGQKVGLSNVSLGRPASGLKSLGFGGMR